LDDLNVYKCQMTQILEQRVRNSEPHVQIPRVAPPIMPIRFRRCHSHDVSSPPMERGGPISAFVEDADDFFRYFENIYEMGVSIAI
jgi:hypothetical protein